MSKCVLQLLHQLNCDGPFLGPAGVWHRKREQRDDSALSALPSMSLSALADTGWGLNPRPVLPGDSSALAVAPRARRQTRAPQEEPD